MSLGLLELIGGVVGGIVLIYLIVFKVLGLRVISSNEVGIVEKWWSNKGNLQSGKFIALNGEAGFQPEVLRTGIHFKPGLMYKVYKKPLVTVPQGQIGYIFARDGIAIPEAQTLGKIVECSNFQDTKAFLENGGQKGPQRAILRAGTYAFNLAQFIVLTKDKSFYLSLGDTTEITTIEAMAREIQEKNGFEPVLIRDDSDTIGIVTVLDGPSLPNGEIIAPIVGDDVSEIETYHNNFQSPENFLKAGGYRGRQLQVVTEGVYYINRLFATIEIKPKTLIGIGYTGVVNSYVGIKGEDITGDENYSHGTLVKENEKGIWEKSLDPGKYALNPYALFIQKVPTTNFKLNWSHEISTDHNYDEILNDIRLITKDAFEPTLPLSVVIHIPYAKASRVVQRFGDVKTLIEQTLDPMISAYFKNIAQDKTLIELIQHRSEIQEQATQEMQEKFVLYNLELEEVLIGTPSSNGDKKIEEILLQLSKRQLAKEQIETFESEKKASEKEKELNEFRAKTKQQTALTESSINIEIQNNEGKAQLERATQEAETKKKVAEAEAYRIEQLAKADAFKTKQTAEAESYKIEQLAKAESMKEAKIGLAKALATKEQVKAYGGSKYQVIQDVMSKFADAIKEGKIDIVPKSVVSMNGNSSESNIPNALEGLMGMLLSEKIGADLKEDNSIEENQEIIKMKKEIEQEFGKDFRNWYGIKGDSEIKKEKEDSEDN